MRDAKRSLIRALGGLVVVAASWPGAEAAAQAVGFQPVPAPLPSGAALHATPAVSADRRYVRLGVNAGFNELQGFTPMSVPAAVGGGAAGMNGPVGGARGAGAGATGGAAGVQGVINGLGAVGNGGGGAIGVNGPFGFAVSGGFGPFGTFSPLNSWTGYGGWYGPGMNGQGFGYGLGNGGPGMGAGFVPANGPMMPGLTAPGMGQPLTGNVDMPLPPGAAGVGAGSTAADPFDQARPGQGPPMMMQQPGPNPGPHDRNAPRGRPIRPRRGRAPRRAAPWQGQQQGPQFGQGMQGAGFQDQLPLPFFPDAGPQPIFP